MPKLSHAGFLDEGRRKRVWQKTGASNGGKRQSNSSNRPVANWRPCYFAFGDNSDVFAIVDFPDNVSAAAISLAGNGAGQANVKATVLITPEEMDQAAQKSQVFAHRVLEKAQAVRRR